MNSFIRVIFALMPLLFCCFNVFAVPAYPYKVEVVTINGKATSIYMRGDEYQKYAVTEDGYTLLSDSEGWWYANQSNEGGLVKTDFRLMVIEDETDELKQFKLSCPKGIKPKKTEQSLMCRVPSTNNTNSHEPIVGERRALVILMQYKDLAFKLSKEEFEQLFNVKNYTADGATGSVRDYYHFASQGQLNYISDVYGPYTSKNSMRYYGANASSGGSDSNPLELCIEAIKSLPEGIDFSVYDNDDDGLVDNVHIIFAGYGEEAGASADAIWAHEFPHRIALRNEVGYSFAGYSCSPELRGNRGSNITNIGVICHELGHALGAMDYYDTNYGTGGEYEGTGQWDIMASGSWNDNGKTPCNFNPYVRSTVFGWNKQVTLSANQQISMPRMETDNPELSIIYRMETGSNGDYFLLENRQKYKFDAALPGTGLMVYHVHPNIDRYNSTNTVNATSPQGLYPVCAAYSEPGKKKYGNINTAECPFPGSTNVRSFSPASSPAAIAWNGSAAKISIAYISFNTSDGSISFTTGNEIIDEPDLPDTPTEKNLIYLESFEKSLTGRMTVNSIFGDETWRTYTKGNYVMNADFIPEATDGDKILMLFSGKGNLMNESETVSRDIDVEPGVNYTISIDVYSEAGSSTTIPTFSLFIEDEYGEYNIYTLDEATNEWKHIELPLTFASNKFSYKLYGRVYTGGVFVDNLRLYKEEQTSVLGAAVQKGSSINIYRIDGTQLSSLKRHQGINIIRKQDGETYKVLVK